MNIEITMSVNARVFQTCQLDACADYYGLTPVRCHRKGYWFTGSPLAWRKLAGDVKYRTGGSFDPACALSKGIDLHSRIDKAIAAMRRNAA
jgi:hypothetical protein